jgi:hypothetical protein
MLQLGQFEIADSIIERARRGDAVPRGERPRKSKDADFVLSKV